MLYDYDSESTVFLGAGEIASPVSLPIERSTMWFRPVAALILSLTISICAHAQPRSKPSAAGFDQVEQAFQRTASEASRGLIAVLAVGPQAVQLVGSGFLVGDQSHFLTAVHVVRQDLPEGVSLAAFMPGSDTKNLYPVLVVEMDTDHDVALCRLDLRGSSHSAPVRPLKLNSGPVPSPGTFVTVAGFPLGEPRPTFQFGNVISFTEPGERIALGVMLNDGSSGGPVIEVRSGNVAGIIVAVRMSDLYETRHSVALGKQNSGISWAVPVSDFRPLLQKYGLLPKTD